MVDERSEAVATMTPAIGLALMLLSVLVSATPAHAQSDADRLDRLIRQLGGNGCAFTSTPYYSASKPPCELRKGIGFLDWLFRSDLECIRDAAYCLATLGPAAKPAVPALIEAARTGPNDYDTGDGTIAVRSAIVEALGRTGDARALPVLIEALEHPKPMDVSLGAIPRTTPVGEGPALNALGYLGPAAAAAVPRISPYLEHRDRQVVEAAATALGRIGDASAIPALIKALQRNDTAHRVSYALRHFGPAASEALPILVRLIEEKPDRDGEVLIRLAIAAIGGPTAADALPKPYSMMLNEIGRTTRAAVSRHGHRLRNVQVSSPQEAFSAMLSGGGSLKVTMSRATWGARRIVEGTVTVSLPGKEPIHEAFQGLEQLENIMVRAFGPSPPL